MTIPVAAIEAAAEALYRSEYPEVDVTWRTAADVHPNDWTHQFRDFARAAIEAAMPAIREAIAQEIEAHPGPTMLTVVTTRSKVRDAYFSGLRKAARIVRGGTP